MKALVWVAVAGLAACGACVGSRYEEITAAPRDLACHQDDIEISEPSKEQALLLRMAGAPTQAVTRGCGKRVVYARMCKPDGSACDWYSVKKLRVEQLLDRVAFEMRCAKDKVTTTSLSPNTVGVAGCGQQATYVWSCPHGPEFFSSACNWVLNSDSRPSASAAAP